MADTETEESSGEEVEGEEIEEDDEESGDDYHAEVQSRMRNGGGTVVTVITRNVKEVSWPPPDTIDKEKINSMKILPDLREKVHLGRNRRQKMDLEMKNFQGSTAHYSSNPFSKGNLQPGKLIAEEKWQPKQSTRGTVVLQERPKMVLRETSSVLTQGRVVGNSEYKIPPGTTRHGVRGQDSVN